MGPLTQEEACAILSVRASASQEDLRRAWRTLALRWHPDKNAGDEVAAAKFLEATAAFKALSHADVDTSKSYEQLCADMDDARAALLRATELAGRTSLSAGDAENTSEKMLKMGGATWVGEVSAGRPHGAGSLILPSGSVHSGRFDEGRASGAGVLYEASGSMFAGEWKENRRCGAFETTDPKGGTWHDVYVEGKRVSRKKGAPPPAGAGAVRCAACGVKFHARASSRCMHHSGKWMEAPTHNADGTPAIVDRHAFPDGGLWLCCGAKAREPKDGERGCTIGPAHRAPLPPAPVPEERRIAGGGTSGSAIPTFVETTFTTKVEYEAWRRSVT